jgi:hypothetical protein
MSRIDASHHSFKRAGKIGPGPKKREIEQQKQWECQKGKKTKGHYVQVCTFIGSGPRKGKKLTVKTDIGKKKKYNALYRKWRKSASAAAKASAALAKKAPRKGYRCRSTPVAKCG